MTVNITTPVGRVVQGSVSKLEPVIDDMTKQQRVTKSGDPQVEVFFSIALPKTPGQTHWNQTPWGAQIWEEGKRGHPQFHTLKEYSWKVVDGDSTEVTPKRMRPYCAREGFPGHWVLFCKQGFLPKTCTTIGWNKASSANPPVIPADGIRCGDYVQVSIMCQPNTGKSPGVYLNPSIVALAGHGPAIVSGPDLASAGFGGVDLPAGASVLPVAALPTAGGPPSTPAPAAPPAPPNTAILSVPAVGPTHVMTPLANGSTYEMLIKAGWNDTLLVQHGMMQA
jgi:hypothetical protein